MHSYLFIFEYICWYVLIFVDMHSYLFIFDICWYVLIFVDMYWYLLIFELICIHICLFKNIFVDMLISVDMHWYLLICCWLSASVGCSSVAGAWLEAFGGHVCAFSHMYSHSANSAWKSKLGQRQVFVSDVCWYLLRCIGWYLLILFIVIDQRCWFSFIVDIYWCLWPNFLIYVLMFVDIRSLYWFRWYALIFVHMNIFHDLLIFVDIIFVIYIYWYLLIFVWYVLIFVDMHLYLLICRWYLLICMHICLYLSKHVMIFVDMYWYLLICIDICWYLLICIHICSY